MSRTIEAIYENGIFRPLVAIDLPDNSIVELDWRLPENGKDFRQTVRGVFQQAGLSKPVNFNLQKSAITEERRKELAEKFSAEKPLGEYIDEDREGRG